MADDVQALIAELGLNMRTIERQQTRLVKSFDTTFNRIEKGGSKSLTRVEKRSEDMSRNVRRAIAAIALGVAGREVTSYADTWTDLNNKVKAAGQVAGIQGRGINALAVDARAARSEIEPYVDLYSRILRASKGVAESEREVAKVTQITAKAFSAGGAGASEQAAGVLQLGQALGSGFLQGDELRSLRENAPLVAKAIADAMGTSIGGLKQLGAEGKITSDIVFKALLGAEDAINGAFAVTVPRASMEAVLAFDNLKLKVGEFLVEGGQVAAVGDVAAAAINFVADNLEALTAAIIVGSAALAGFFGTQGLLAVAANLNKVAVGATVTARALALLRAGAAAMTGPWLVGGFAAGLALIALGMGDITKKSKTASESISSVTDALRKYGRLNTEIELDLANLTDLQDDLTRAIEGQQPAIEAAKRADIAALKERIAKNQELARVYEALARADLANAKNKVGDIGYGQAKDLFGDKAFNQEIVPASGLREGGLRSVMKSQDELNALLKEEYEQIRAIQDADGKTNAQQTELLDFYSKRLAAMQEIASLEERVADLGAAKTGGADTPAGAGGGGSPDKKEQTAIKRLEDSWSKALLTKRQLAEKTYQDELEQIKGLSVDQAKKDEMAQRSLEARDKALKDIGKEEQEAKDKALEAARQMEEAWNSAFLTRRDLAENAYQEELRQIAALEVAQSKKDELANKALQVRDKAIEDIGKAEQASLNELLDARDAAAGNEIAIIKRRAEAAKAAKKEEIDDADKQAAALALIDEERDADIKKFNDKEAKDKQDLIDQVLSARANALGDYESLAQSEYDALVKKIDAELTAEEGKYEVLKALEEAHLETVKDIRERMSQDRLDEALREADTVGEGFRAQWDIMREESAKAAGDIGILFADTFGPGGTVQEAIGESAGRAIAFGDDFSESMENAARSIASNLISALVQYGIQMVAQAALGQALGTAAVAATSAQAAASAAAWAPAAAAASLATLGANAAPAAAALTSTHALSAALSAIPGFADGVIDFKGKGTGRSDSNLVRMSNHESMITADGTRKNANLLKRINAGEDVEAQLARAGQPVNINPAVYGGSRSVNIGGSSFAFHGPVDQGVLPQFQAMLDQRDRDLSDKIQKVMAREETVTTPRHKRKRFFKG